jgi:aspartate oxidase
MEGEELCLRNLRDNVRQFLLHELVRGDGPILKLSPGNRIPAGRQVALEPMKKVAVMLRRHRELILNYFRARKQFSGGVVEGLKTRPS